MSRFILNLRLFDGAAAAAGGADGGAPAESAGSRAAANTGMYAPSPQETSGRETSGVNPSLDAAKTRAQKRAAAKNSLADVKYGKQEIAAEPVQDAAEQDHRETEPAPEQTPPKTFDELIKGEYKQAFDERVQKIINGRFKETGELKKQLQGLTPVVDALSAIYHVEDKNPEKILEAIESDNKLYEVEAEKKGMTTDQLREVRKMERQNAELKRALDARQAQEQHEQNLLKWRQESEAVQKIYPSFQLSEESKNPQFVGLLRNGIDIRTAYEVIHKDEIIGGAMQYTAQKVSEQVANNIKAKAARPAENGMHSSGGVVSKTDVSQLTKADLANIRKKVARGEKIVF